MDKKVLLPIGGLIVIVCFFLPWIRACDIDASGLQLATDNEIGNPIFWLILIAGICIAGAYWLTKHKAGVIAVISSIAGLLILLWKILVPISKGEWREVGASIQVGGLGTILGFILAFIGGISDKKRNST